jgi:hypothetical protein
MSKRGNRNRFNQKFFENLEGRMMLSGGGGGGGTKPVLPTPAIPASTFDGIGSGPTYIHESFGFAQGTRYKQNGSITAVNIHDNINGIRAEFPNNKTETWIAPVETVGGQEYDFAVVGPSDPYEPYTPLQMDSVNGFYSDGCLALNGSDPLGAGVDLRPNAIIPFAAPTSSASTVSADAVAMFSKTAIGFTSSGAVNKNFEASGQAWLEVDFTGNFPAGGSTFIDKFVFHTNGTAGASVSGTFDQDPTGFNQLAVSYDPVNHVATASINGNVVASLPYALTGAIKYTGVEGSWYSTIDNFTVQTGAIAVPVTTASAVTAPSSSSSSSSLFSSTSIGTVASSVLGTGTTSVLGTDPATVI